MHIVLVWAAEHPSNSELSILLQYIKQLREYTTEISIIAHHTKISRLQTSYFAGSNTGATVQVYYNPGWRFGFIRWVNLVVQKCTSASVLILPDVVGASTAQAIQVIASKHTLPVVVSRFSMLQITNKKRQKMRMAHQRMLLQATIVQTDSAYLYEQTQRMFPNIQHIVHTPLVGVDREKITAIKAPPVAWDIATVTPLRGQHGLEELFTVTKDINQCRILVIGDGSDLAKLQKQVEQLGMKGRVQFTGWFPTIEEVISAIKTTRMFVANSQHLQSQLMIMQAMACMVPVVSAPTEYAKSFIEHGTNGRLTDGTQAGLLNQIEWCLQHAEQRVYLAEKAYHDIDAYAPAKVHAQWQAFMRSVL